MNETTLSPLIAHPSTTPGFLVVESGSLSGQQFMLPSAPGALVLGRERTCGVRFDPEKDRVVGRTHARLEVRSDGVYLVDLHSANGTFRMDGSPVRGEVRLNHGERFQLGGEGGPWLSLQLPLSPATAVHLAPPQAEAMTLIRLPTAPLPQPIVATRPPVTAPRPAPALAPSERVLPATPAPAVRAELQHRREYQQQIALICLLLFLANAVGLWLGLRDTQGEEEAAVVSSARSAGLAKVA